MNARLYDPVDVARQFRYVREIPANRGQRVEALQRWSGGVPGDSWCAHFATFVLDICYQGDAPIPRTGSCDEILTAARRNGWLVPTPQPGDLVLSISATNANDAHHVGIITSAMPLRSIAGNTDATGVSSNGDRVAEHAISAVNKLYVRLPMRDEGAP